MVSRASDDDDEYKVVEEFEVAHPPAVVHFAVLSWWRQEPTPQAGLHTLAS
jgi:hypothetical protein